MRRAALLVLLVACSSKDDTSKAAPAAPPPPPPAAAPKAVEPPAAPVATKTEPAKPADKPAAKTPTPATDEDKVLHAKYRAAMNKGRKLTDQKKYTEAIAAFDEAIAAKKSDARAVSERGFARLLAGDLDGASRDLDEAAGASKDSRLLSQIWFNRGLVDDKRDRHDNALVDFYLANKLRPSEAAKKKLAGSKTVCPAYVERDYKPTFDAPTLDAADWLALTKAMPISFVDPPATAVDARKALKVDEPKLPAIAVDGEPGMGRLAYLVVTHGKQLRAIPVGEDDGGRCPGEIAFDIVATKGSVVHVHGTELNEGGLTDMCRDKNDELVECTDAPGETFSGHACFAPDPIVRDIVIDTETGKLLRIERPQMADGADITVKLDDKGVHIGGLDCDETVSW